MNLNVHFHSLVLDGVYTRPTPTARPVFHRLPPPTDADIAALLTRLQRRVRRLLARRGRLAEAAEATDPFAAQELLRRLPTALRAPGGLQPPTWRCPRIAGIASNTSPATCSARPWRWSACR